MSKKLLDAGVNLQNVTTAIGFLMQRDVDQLEHVTIMCDGEEVHECTTSDQMIALLQSGKAVFGVSVGSLWHQIHDALETEDYVDLQSSSANVGSAGRDVSPVGQSTSLPPCACAGRLPPSVPHARRHNRRPMYG